MADPAALTHAFMRAHPADAARVLESLPVDAAAELLARVPVRLAAGVLAETSAGAAARSLERLDDERAMALLAALGAQPAAAALRHVDAPRRARLIGGLPTATALASRLLLGYPEDTVGAWADPDVVALAPTARAGDALERVRQAESEVVEVFVVGAAQRLLGRIGVAALLRAPASVPLDSLAAPTAGVLPAQTPLAGALAHPGWERVSSLPVVDTDTRLRGVLSRAALNRALHRVPGEAARADDESLTGLAARNFWAALSGFVEVGLAALPPVRPVEARRDDR